MALVSDGDPCAFETIFDRHAAVAFSLAVRICGRAAMAEDVVQEAFLSLWRGRARYDPARGTVRSWMLGVVHSRAIEALRGTPLSEGPLSDPRNVLEEAVRRKRLDAHGLTETAHVRSDEAREIRRALDDLPPEQRQAIELAYFDGFTDRQIAHMLKLTTGTVKGRARLGLHRLRAALRPEVRASQMAPDGGPIPNQEPYLA